MPRIPLLPCVLYPREPGPFFLWSSHCLQYFVPQLGTYFPSGAPDLFWVLDVGLFSCLSRSDRFYFLLVFCLLKNTFSCVSHYFCSALVNTSLWLTTKFINYSFHFAKESIQKFKTIFICDYVLLNSLFQQAKHFQQAFGSSIFFF